MNSAARVAAVAQVAMGYFENTVTGKMTEPRVAVFWANFIIYRGRCVSYLECIPGNFRTERRL